MSCLGCLDRLKKLTNIFAHQNIAQLVFNLTDIEILTDSFLCDECIEKLTEACLFKNTFILNLQGFVEKVKPEPEISTDPEDFKIAECSINEEEELFDETETYEYLDDDIALEDDCFVEVSSEVSEEIKFMPLKEEKQFSKSQDSPIQRKSYTAKFKLQVIQYAEKNGNTQAARIFKINESCVRLWRTQKVKLTQMDGSKKSMRTGSCQWKEIDYALKSWVDTQKQKGNIINSSHIKVQAVKIAEELNVEKFPASKVWLYSFMKRHNIPMLRSNRSRIKIETDTFD